MIKTISNVGTVGTYLNGVKVIYDKPTADIILNRKKATSIPLKIRNKLWMSAFTSLIPKGLEDLAITVTQEEEIKGNQMGKAIVKLSFLNMT